MNCGKKNTQRKGALHLTQKVDYGIIILVELAKNHQKGPISIKDIANEKKISFSFLQKIAQNLQEAKLIKAQRGKYGGYQLIKTPKNISIKEIIEALEGPIALAPCLKDNYKCKTQETCNIRPTMNELNEEIKTYFFQKSLFQFVPTNE